MILSRDKFLWVFFPALAVLFFSFGINKPVFLLAGAVILVSMICTFDFRELKQWAVVPFLILLLLWIGMLVWVSFFAAISWGWDSSVKIMI